MPVTKSAIRALRKDRRRNQVNQKIRLNVKKALKSARLTPTEKNIKTAYSVLDRAAKKGIIHRNKAARLKSRLTKLLKNSSKTKAKPLK